MKKAKEATKSLFKGLSRPMRASGSKPFPATTSQSSAGGYSGRTPAISTPSNVSLIVDEASSEQIASTLTTNITQTTQSRAASDSIDVAHVRHITPESVQKEAAASDAVIEFTQVTSLQTASPSAPAVRDKNSQGLIGAQQVLPIAPIEPAPTTPVTTETRLSRSVEELYSAVETFKKNYEQFAAQNTKFLLIGDEFQTSFANATATNDIRRSAEIFGDGVWSTLRAIESKHTAANTKWTSKVGNFLAKLYPVASLTLNLAVAASGAASFAPLNGAAAGLGIILQILDDEAGRGEEFMFYLRRIEFEATLLADNPHYDLSDSGSPRNLVQEKSTDLMTAIIVFFNSSLIYFRKSFFGNIWRTVVNGAQIYEDGQKRLEIAILEYDRAVFHLAARAVTELKYQTSSARMQQKDEELLRWLAPSHWLVEAQLSLFRQQRGENTLEWARDMPEFQTWRLSNLETSKDRVLWIRGTLGVGKSIMAAYFIDLLKVHYPKAIVAYFFCRSKQAGLTEARDIIRTLAYQCTVDDEAARSVLHELKRKDFRASEKLSVGFMCEKLLLEPLRGCKRDLFLVLDGVDEADSTTPDEFDRHGTPELEVLLKSFTKLPHARLLFMSRPVANIANIVPGTTVKHIGKDENADDIDNYVANFVAGSERLQTLFQMERLDPIGYFREKANGIFLWVVLVIQQLAKAKSTSNFKMYLQGFSDASGSMEMLYARILSRIAEDDRKWVKEIIRWLISAETELNLEELQNAVEWSLNDKLVDFEGFLEVECGSVVLVNSDYSAVQLVHETLKSFVQNSIKCPSEFFLDVEESHAHLALNCLQYSSTGPRGSFLRYSSQYWFEHLSRVTSQKQFDLIPEIRKLFTSAGVMNWLRDFPSDRSLRQAGFGLRTSFDEIESVLAVTTAWLGDHSAYDGNDSAVMMQVCGNDGDFRGWGRDISSGAKTLGEYVGKAAARLWLGEEFPFDKVRYYFRLAMKYYWGRPNRIKSNMEELDELVATTFTGIAEWAKLETEEISMLTNNLAVAFGVLFKWHECVEHLSITKYEGELIEYLAMAYMALGNYYGAVEVLNECSTFTDEHAALYCSACVAAGDRDRAIQCLVSVDSHFDRNVVCELLWDIYMAMDDRVTTVKAVETALARVTKESGYPWDLESLLLRMSTIPDGFEVAIRFLRGCEKGISVHGDDSESFEDLAFVAGLYEQIGALDEAIRVVSACKHYDPWRYWIWRRYFASNEDCNAIEAIEEAIRQHPGDVGFLRCLANAKMTKGDYKGAIAAFESALNILTEIEVLRPTIGKGCATELLGAYRENKEYDKAIRLYEEWSARGDFTSYLWTHELFRVFEAKGDYQGAVDALGMIVKRSKSELSAKSLLFKALLAVTNNCDEAVRRIAPDGVESQSPFQTDGLLECEILDAYKTNGNLVEAIERGNKLVELLPTEAWAWHALGDAYRVGREHEKAIELYKSAIKRFRIDYSFYIKLGDVYLETLAFNEATEQYSTACKRTTDPFFVYAYLSMHTQGDLFPFNDQFVRQFVWYGLAKSKLRMGERTAAAQIYENAIAHYEMARNMATNFLCWFHGSVRLERGQFEVFHKSDLPKAAIWVVLGEAYKAKGDREKATAAFRHALAISPRDLWLQRIVSEGEMAISSLADELHDERIAAGNENQTRKD